MYFYSVFKMIALLYQPKGLVSKFEVLMDKLLAPSNLLLRYWLAHAFWVSAQLKLQNWDSTLYLFEYEYAVPLLSTDIAAVLATTVELVGPALLVIGLHARGAAMLLFLFNSVAVISYPDLNAAGIEQHKLWGVLLLVVFLHGPGRWSLDALIKQRFFSAGAL